MYTYIESEFAFIEQTARTCMNLSVNSAAQHHTNMYQTLHAFGDTDDVNTQRTFNESNQLMAAHKRSYVDIYST